MWLHICANLWVKIPTFGGSKKFDKDFEKRNFCTRSPARHPEGVAPPQKWYHLIASIPAHLKPPSHFDTPSLLHRVNIDFLKTPDFGQSTWTALESPKNDICQNWPQGAIGDVSSCLETKFDKKMSMESVPNWPKEIADHDPIRWFKCKLKPPKNRTSCNHTSQNVTRISLIQAAHWMRVLQIAILKNRNLNMGNISSCSKRMCCAITLHHVSINCDVFWSFQTHTMSWLQSTLLQHEEEEPFSEQTSECGFSYSECSSLQSEPLDLSMKPWFADGSPQHPFKELVSFTKITLLYLIFFTLSAWQL